MRIGYITRTVDEGSPVVATQVSWIRELALQPRVQSVEVLTSHLGDANLPANVSVTQFGRGRSWPYRFMRRAHAVRSDVDFYFVSQGGPFPALLLPMKWFGGPRIYQWKAHSVVSPRMKFYARWCDDLVFTASATSLPIKTRSKRVVGHGIDTSLFVDRGNTNPVRDILYFGRVSPIKGLDDAIRSLGLLRDSNQNPPNLDVVGPVRADYREILERLARSCGVADSVRFLPAAVHSDLPELIAQYKVTLNLSETALDKSALESMACGVPVLTSNPSTIESLPPDIVARLAVDRKDIGGLATAMVGVLGMDCEDRQLIGRRLRSIVVQGHSLQKFFEKILDEIEEFQNSL